MIKKLERKEHGRTRKLWEEVFSEDSEAFLNYYYREVVAQNTIYAIEEEGEIRAMLQLNPYRIQAGPWEGRINYIVGVATRKPYRGRGYMAELLNTSLKEMREHREPFVFLMPAAEAIYYPHAFRFIYRQDRCRLSGKEEGTGFSFREAGEEDCALLAEFAEACLKEMCPKNGVYARRDAAYYSRMRKEQASENGGIRMVYQGTDLAAVLYDAREEEQAEIREPLFAAWLSRKEKRQILSQAAYLLTGSGEREVFCQGYGDEEKKPVIMARLVCLPEFFQCFTAKEKLDGYLFVEDEALKENTGWWHVHTSKGEMLRAEKIEETQLPENGKTGRTILTPGFLMSALSGHMSLDAAASQEKIFLDQKTRQLLKQIRPWEKVFLNEIV